MFVVASVLAGPSAAMAAGFVEDFATDPVAGGRWQVLDGDPARFIYDAGNAAMTAAYDTALPTARLVRALPTPVNEASTFHVALDLEIRSEGFYADPALTAQIAFGFLHRALTGLDRAGGQGGNAYNLASIDYFPNVTSFGGPTLGPTLIRRDTGIGFFPSIDFTFGEETLLDDPGEQPLPLDTLLHMELHYSGTTRSASMTVATPGGPLPINAVGRQQTAGGPDADATTIQTFLLDGGGFDLDAFGILLWRDTYATTSTVRANVVFRRVEVEVAEAIGPDLDGDGDVDVSDFVLFQACFNGPDVPPAAGCTVDADFDDDGDVDVADYVEFQSCYNGPDVPPACS